MDGEQGGSQVELDPQIKLDAVKAKIKTDTYNTTRYWVIGAITVGALVAGAVLALPTLPIVGTSLLTGAAIKANTDKQELPANVASAAAPAAVRPRNVETQTTSDGGIK